MPKVVGSLIAVVFGLLYAIEINQKEWKNLEKSLLLAMTSHWVTRDVVLYRFLGSIYIFFFCFLMPMASYYHGKRLVISVFFFI